MEFVSVKRVNSLSEVYVIPSFFDKYFFDPVRITIHCIYVAEDMRQTKLDLELD